MSNSLFVIAPYKALGMWVFDDERVGLVQEPFVAGADTIIDEWTKDLPNAEKGFRLIFSPGPFPGYTLHMEWRREEMSGNTYFCESLNMEGWLCPALFKYFEEAPKNLYAKAEGL